MAGGYVTMKTRTDVGTNILTSGSYASRAPLSLEWSVGHGSLQVGTPVGLQGRSTNTSINVRVTGASSSTLKVRP